MSAGHDRRAEPEQLLVQFDRAWQGGTVPQIEDYVDRFGAAGSVERRAFLEELVQIDLEYRWRGGRGGNDALGAHPRLEAYVARYPEIGRLDQLPLKLVTHEYEVRRSWGDRPGPDEYEARFPRHGPGLRQALRRIDAELTAEFGRGGAARGGRRAARPSSPATAPAPAAPRSTTDALLETLRQGQILSRAQLTQLERDLRGVQDPKALARHLGQRGWLTSYQIDQLVAGRGAELVVGPHLLLERLGEGGTGQVFKARHQKMGRVVAVKLIRKELLSDAEVVARFYREIRVVSQLTHPNVVHAYDAGPQGADHVLVMEFVEGTDLARLVKDEGPLPAAKACDSIRQAALGLQHAHERGLVHRDIKPPNLLLTRQGVVKVLDLGLARLQRPGRDARPGDDVTANLLTPVGSVMMGTPDYMAPEQAVDFHAADIRADIYSLGCTLHFLLTGQPPFPGGSLLQKLMRHQQAEPPSMRQKCPELPAELDAILQKMLAKRPEQRYQTPNEVAQALAPFAGAGGVRAASPARGAAARCRGWKRTAGTALLLVGLLVSAGLLWKGLGGRPTSPDTLAAPRQPTAPDEAGPPRPWFKNHLHMEFVLIPSGEFLMGSPTTETDRLVHEGPPRKVRINKSFYMGRYEVTQGQYQRLIGKNPSFFHPGNKEDLSYPVENVTWEDAQAFCERLSAEDAERRAGRVYRLPSEAEWEYACRAGSQTKFCFGDDVGKLGDYAWYKDNSNGMTHRVGGKQANRWGVHDMLGNVAEWVSDPYSEVPWRGIPVPALPGPNRRATTRGGAFDLDPARSRSASRGSGESGKRYNHVGFRVVCEIPERAP